MCQSLIMPGVVALPRRVVSKSGKFSSRCRRVSVSRAVVSTGDVVVVDPFTVSAVNKEFAKNRVSPMRAAAVCAGQFVYTCRRLYIRSASSLNAVGTMSSVDTLIVIEAAVATLHESRFAGGGRVAPSKIFVTPQSGCGGFVAFCGHDILATDINALFQD